MCDLRRDLRRGSDLIPFGEDDELGSRIGSDELPVPYLLKQGADKTPGKKRKLSPAGRRAISLAQKARWAAQRKEEK